MSIETNSLKIFFGGGKESHAHTDIEILYVLEGALGINIGNRNWQAKENDILLVNSGEMHGFHVPDSALVCQLTLDYYALKDLLGRSRLVFTCNSVAEPEKSYSRHKYFLDAMLEHYAEDRDVLAFQSLYYMFLEVLRSNNLENEKDHVGESESGQKIRRALKYIDAHYMEELSLTELAQREYLSVSAFSRLFKKETGSGFVEYVRQVRLGYAESRLLHTNRSVTEIASDCGFSSLSVFNKSFKQKFGVSPTKYREDMRKDEGVNGADKSERFRNYIRGRKRRERRKEDTVRYISADLAAAVPFHNGILTCMNAGKTADLLEGKVQNHVRKAVEGLGIKYIRIYNPFDYALQIRADHETKNLNFEKLDAVLDFILETGCIPVIEFPDRKKKLVIDIGSKSRYEYIDPGVLFLSIREWEEALDTLMDHVVKRYTVREVGRWFFEIWYDAEHVTGSGQIPYDELYGMTRKVIRRFVPSARVGGSGLSIEMGADLLERQLRWWKEREDRPDFLTFISYPYRVRKKDGLEYDLLKVESDLHFVRYDLDRYNALLKSVGYPSTPIWISEWNTSLSERNIYNDSCGKACHMLVQMTDAAGRPEMMAYGNISDCISQYYDSVSPLIGATGLLTRDGLMKPAYYAMEFWAKLGDQLVKRGGELYDYISEPGQCTDHCVQCKEVQRAVSCERREQDTSGRTSVYFPG